MRSSVSLSQAQVSLPGMLWQISQWIFCGHPAKKILFVGILRSIASALPFRAKGL